MSWQRYARYTKWYNLWQGLWTEDSVGDIPMEQIALPSLVSRVMKEARGLSYLARASNVYSPGVSRLIRKRPGFAVVNTNAISATGIFTGFVHLGEIADKFLSTTSIAGTSHNIYDFSNDAPTAVTGGTNPTIGADNLCDTVLFHDGVNPVAIFVWRLRDLPQSVTGGVARANHTIAGTGLTSLKPAVIEVFQQRLLCGDCNVDGTVFDDRVYWTDIRDGNLITTPTTQFLSFETRLKDKVRAIRKLSDICMVGKLNNVFTMAPTQDDADPFIVQEEAGGKNKGPVSQQAVVEADQRLFWIGQSNIHSLDQNFEIRDWADAIQPTIRGLNDSRRDFSVAGVDADRSLILFNVSDSGQTTNDLTIGLNYKTGALYLWTLRRNAFGYREVSGQIRLVGGGHIGVAYYEMTGTAGDLDSATAVIDGDVITPKYWLNAYGTKQKIPYVLLKVDPVGSEALTITYALDDEDILTSPRTPAGSPYTVAGNTDDTIVVPIKAFSERVNLRIRNNAANVVYLVKAVGIPGLPLQPSMS